MGLVRMARPIQLLLVCFVYGMGVLLAVARGAPLDVLLVVVGLTALVPATLSVHYINEYADHETDALTDRTPYSGGSGALTALNLPRSVPLTWAVVTAGLSLATAVAAAVIGLAVPVTAIGILAAIVVLGWLYSVGLRLAWNGLGELDNAVIGGVLLPLFGVAMVAGTVSLGAVLAVLPFGVAVFLNLLATTWPDRTADATVGKKTLATRWSRDRLRVVYAAAIGLFVALVVAFWGSPLPVPVAAGSLGIAPAFVYAFRTYTVRESPAPTVAAMVALAIVQTAGWAWLVV